MGSKKWTKEEDDIVKELYGKIQAGEIAERMGTGRTDEAVRIRAKNLKVNRDRPERWSRKEEALMRDNYESLGPTEMNQLIPNKTITAIKAKALTMGLKNKETRTWTEEEMEFMRNSYQTLSNKQIEKILNRSENSVQRKAEEMGLSHKKEPSSLELLVESWLKDFNVSYVIQQRERYFIIDFVVTINSHLIAIEVNGDYWHCNPTKYPNGPIDKTQLASIERDKRKKEYLESIGYVLYIIWESDLKTNLSIQKQLLHQFLFDHLKPRELLETPSLN